MLGCRERQMLGDVVVHRIERRACSTLVERSSMSLPAVVIVGKASSLMPWRQAGGARRWGQPHNRQSGPGGGQASTIGQRRWGQGGGVRPRQSTRMNVMEPQHRDIRRNSRTLGGMVAAMGRVSLVFALSLELRRRRRNLQLADSRLTVHTLLREDVFAGFPHDLGRFARAERNIDQLLQQRLSERGNHGVEGLHRLVAVLAHEAGKADEFQRLLRRARRVRRRCATKPGTTAAGLSPRKPGGVRGSAA